MLGDFGSKLEDMKKEKNPTRIQDNKVTLFFVVDGSKMLANECNMSMVIGFFRWEICAIDW